MNENTFFRKIKKFFSKREKTEFEKVFGYIENFDKYNSDKKDSVYELLKKLNQNSDDVFCF